MPTCREMSELVTDYLERTLPARICLDARWHLLLCSSCRRYFAQMRATIRVLGSGELPPPEAATEGALLTRLRRGDPPGPV